VYHCILVPWKKQKLKNASQRFLSLLLSHLVYVLREQRESCIGLSCHFGLQKVELLCWYNLWRKRKENYCLAWIAHCFIQSLKYVFWEIIYQMQNDVFTRVFLCFQLAAMWRFLNLDISECKMRQWLCQAWNQFDLNWKLRFGVLIPAQIVDSYSSEVDWCK
jgi:hypothetical protein